MPTGKFSFVLRWRNILRSVRWQFSNTKLSLIDDNDLTAFLKDVGKWDDLLTGRLQCDRCGKPVTLDDLAGFIVDEGNYRFLCNSDTCVAKRSIPS